MEVILERTNPLVCSLLHIRTPWEVELGGKGEYGHWASLGAQMVKNLPAVWEAWDRYLSREDALEKRMATHSSILAWIIPRTEEPGELQSVGSQRVGCG